MTVCYVAGPESGPLSQSGSSMLTSNKWSALQPADVLRLSDQFESIAQLGFNDKLNVPCANIA